MLQYGLCGSIFCTKITGTSCLTIVEMGDASIHGAISGWGGMGLDISLRSAKLVVHVGAMWSSLPLAIILAKSCKEIVPFLLV
jgi:hypothetical protein